MTQSVDGHEAQRFEAPTDLPEARPDGYQARLVRAQRGYQTESDSPWDGELLRVAADDEPGDEQSTPGQRAATEPAQPRRGLMRWLRRRAKGAEADDDDRDAGPAEPARRASNDPARRASNEDAELDSGGGSN